MIEILEHYKNGIPNSSKNGIATFSLISSRRFIIVICVSGINQLMHLRDGLNQFSNIIMSGLRLMDLEELLLDFTYCELL